MWLDVLNWVTVGFITLLLGLVGIVAIVKALEYVSTSLWEMIEFWRSHE